ncbi:MAG: DUF5655 domain-containing protein [Blastococcus sp.]
MTRPQAHSTDPAVAEFFDGQPLGLAAFAAVRRVLAPFGDCSVRVSPSQVTFRRRHGFACLWRPGQYLRNPSAEVVLSIALGRVVPSPRFKQVAHPAPSQWVHHLEIRTADDIDEQVADWLTEAAIRAG